MHPENDESIHPAQTAGNLDHYILECRQSNVLSKSLNFATIFPENKIIRAISDGTQFLTYMEVGHEAL